jgi:hypothetical protein
MILRDGLNKEFPRVTAFIARVHICGPTTTAPMGADDLDSNVKISRLRILTSFDNILTFKYNRKQ